MSEAPPPPKPVRLTAPRSLDEVAQDPTDPRKQGVARWFAARYADVEAARHAWLKMLRVAYRAEGSLKTWEAAENETIVWLEVERRIV